MFKIIKISESQLSSANTKAEDKPAEKAAPKTEKKEAPKPKSESYLLSEANMIDGLVKLSNHLDSIDVLEEADFADKIIDKIARNTLVFDLDSGEVFDKSTKDWRNPTDGELANAFFGDTEPLGDVGDLNPDSISYKKDEDGDDGMLELRDERGKPVATLRVDEPPEYEISWHNLSREHVDSRPKNMTLPDGDSVTIEEIKLESNEMIKELVKLANHLDDKGFAKEADYLDEIIKKSRTTSHDSKTTLRSDKDSESLTQKTNMAGSGDNIASRAQEKRFKVGDKDYFYSYDRDTVGRSTTMELRVFSSDNKTGFTATKNFGSTDVEYKAFKTEETSDENGFINFINSLLEGASDQSVKTSLKTLSSMFVSTANSSKLSA